MKNIITASLSILALTTFASAAQAAEVKLLTGDKEDGITLGATATNIAAIDGSELMLTNPLPANAKTLGRSYIMVAFHNCESNMVVQQPNSARTKKTIRMQLNPNLHSVGKAYNSVIIDEKFSPLPGMCRLNVKITYLNAKTKKRQNLYNHTTQFALTGDNTSKCHARGSQWPDVNNDGTINVEDLGQVNAYIGTGNVINDINGNGIVSGLDVANVIDRLRCGEKPFTCTVENFRAVDNNNDGRITGKDFDAFMQRLGHDNLSAADSKFDLDKDGTITRNDVMLADRTASECQF